MATTGLGGFTFFAAGGVAERTGSFALFFAAALCLLGLVTAILFMYPASGESGAHESHPPTLWV
ncbi:MAG TPA: hypothetical protein VGQ97_01285, partial [Xanthobacteraceae bacterium]|nr:hypothetical protein [Xanthobacteraceae bacterium]